MESNSLPDKIQVFFFLALCVAAIAVLVVVSMSLTAWALSRVLESDRLHFVVVTVGGSADWSGLGGLLREDEES